MKLRKILTYILPFLLIIIGTSLILFPWLNDKKSKTEVNTIVQEFLNEAEKPQEIIEEPTNINEEPVEQPAASNLFGVMTIPAINIQAPIKEGIDDYTLNTSVGVYFTSDIPLGTKGGNMGFAAHSLRGSIGTCWYCYFNYIDQLKIGDDIFITDRNKIDYHYQVFDVKTYQDPESDYAYQTNEDEARITLITCSDGNADYRTFVLAKRID